MERGQTLAPQLRSAYSGERLGFAFADQTKNVVCLDHRYRLCLTVGVQPGRSEWLLDEAQINGGTPQRFVWWPVIDPEMPDVPPDAPARLELPAWDSIMRQPSDNPKIEQGPALQDLLDLPVNFNELFTLDVPEHIKREVDKQHVARHRGEGESVDGHRTQSRLKVAAGLMWLHGRTDGIADEDWQRAGLVMDVSDDTRKYVQRTLRVSAHIKNVNRGKSEAVREVSKSESTQILRRDRVAKSILQKLSAEDGQTKSGLRRSFGNKEDREIFDLVLPGLVKAKKVRIAEYRGNNGKTAERVWLV